MRSRQFRFLLVALLLIVCIDHIPSPAFGQWPPSETRLVVVIAGLPEGEQVNIYINGRENGTASLTSPLVRTLSSGATISITADIYIEGAWGYSYELVGVRRGQSPPQTQPSITLDSDLIILVCEYSSHHILLSPLLVPLYALLILIGIWSIVRWLSSLVQPSQRAEGKGGAAR